MKKALAVILSLLIACTVFALFVNAAGNAALDETKDPYETDIPQVITNIADEIGVHPQDHQQDLNTGLTWLRDATRAAADFFRDLADRFNRFVEWFQNIRIDNLFDRIAGAFNG